ncbi:hypothetical protein Tco_0065268 [Tanacetum coccineum]
MSDMTTCLNDLSYIPLNNEQNEPTQGDIGETSNDPTQAKRNEFKELYASANEELYPGCDYVTRLDFMAKFTYFKVKGSKVIDISCANLELHISPAFFDIMIYLVIHLPLKALEGGPIRPRWMYPFERYMKKLKNYVRNKAKPEGSIVEGYVAEEALTFSSHYFRDVTTKFNRPDRNMDFPPPTCQFQVFKSLCKSIGLRSVIRIDHQELKKVIWYVLHNSPEIDTYRAKFKSEFPNKDMKEEFPGWFRKQIRLQLSEEDDGQCHVDKGPRVRKQRVIRFGLWTITNSNLKDDPDVIHVDNSSDLSLSTSLNDLEIAALHKDGQSIDVDVPLDIIDVVDEDDDIIDEEDPIPHDLVDSDDEDLVNLNIDDGVNVVYSSEEED